MHKKVYFLIL